MAMRPYFMQYTRPNVSYRYIVCKDNDMNVYKWNLLLCFAAMKGGTCSKISRSTAAR